MLHHRNGGDRKIAIYSNGGDRKIKYLFDRGDREISSVKFPRFFSPPPAIVNDVSLRPFKIDCMFCISLRVQFCVARCEKNISFFTTEAHVNFWDLCCVFAPAHSISKIS